MRSTLAVSQTSTATATAAAARGHRLGAREVDVGDRDARALGRHRDRAGPAHARAAADDERHLALEPSAHGRSSRPEQVGLPGQVLALAAVAPGRLGDRVGVDLDAQPGRRR